MPNKFLNASLGIGVLIFTLAGCASSGNNNNEKEKAASKVTTRGYIAIKDRVDQKMEGGNYGYLYGTPIPEDREELKKTRKIYVLEVSQNPVQPDASQFELPERKKLPIRSEAVAPSGSSSAQNQQETPEWAKPVDIPQFDFSDEDSGYTQEEDHSAPTRTAGASYVDYTVQKNDTLQKISKKFYDSYKKWSQIYDANKDVIKNPNAIKPGIVLRIPIEE